MAHKVVLGVDFGEARIGLAIGDTDLRIALPLKTINARNSDPIQEIKKVVAERGVDIIVIGMPLLLSGEKGRLAGLVEEFAEKLRQEVDAEIVFWDERFTSVMAEDVIRQTGQKPSRRKHKVDMLAAHLILQEYLNSIE